MAIRQPIVTLVGHVDHGKTSILDSIRSSAVAAKEVGGITQIISFTSFPAEILKDKCKELLRQSKIKVEIPGFLFIDTPGHAAFTNLRKRGGALADLAILIIDINEGIMPQTVESIEILKANKIPFIVALNKIDAISGWKKQSDNLIEDINKQADFVKKNFEEKFYRIIGGLSEFNFDSDLFNRISNFTKQLALVPCSGKTSEGISELLVMLAGLSQKFLKGKLELKEKEAKGTILEVKREKEMLYLEAIVYDGILNVNDMIVVAGLAQPIVTKVRALFEALPLAGGFRPVKKVKAASGIRMQVPEAATVLPGMPFIATTDISKASKGLQKEVSDTIKTDREGIIIKADSLGSLEALLMLLRKKRIEIRKVGIGNVNKVDVISAVSEDPLNEVALGFNVGISEDVKNPKVKILTNNVIYRLIEDFEKWQQEKQKEIEREKLIGMVMPFKIKVLPFIFRKNKPAIFGARIIAGTVKPGMYFTKEGKTIDKIKGIQSKGKNIEKASKGEEVAISCPNITIGRQVEEVDILYSDINEENFKKLRENKKFLTPDEIKILQEIAQIKRKEKATWGL